MTPKKAKYIGIIVISIFTIIHSFFYILANVKSAKSDDFITMDSLYLFDTIIPFSILSTILLGQKIGDRMIINYHKADNFTYAANVLQQRRTWLTYLFFSLY